MIHVLGLVLLCFLLFWAAVCLVALLYTAWGYIAGSIYLGLKKWRILKD